jgi:death-on-curing protein
VTIYATVDEVIAVHGRLIARFGSAAGIRDRETLEAAVARLQTGYYQDLIEEAAALWESLSQTHPFIDGNKRVAGAFLKVDGSPIEFDDLEAYRFLIDLYDSGRMRFSELERWLRAHVRS